jgi:GntR family transcriptional regulator
VKVEIPQEERKKKLNDICTEFFNIAASYGFTEEDLIEELKKYKEVQNGNDRSENNKKG